MAKHCCESTNLASPTDPVFKRVLWFALIVNAMMFVVEFIASGVSDSVSLKADALDFLSDATNYAISLFVVTSSVSTRAKASIFKAISMLLLGVFVLYSAVSHAINGSLPVAATISLIGFIAFMANLAVAFALYRFRGGDSNMQSVWLCSRNDAIGNLAVIAAGAGVFISQTRWPDLGVAIVIAYLAISSAWRVLKLASAELNQHANHQQPMSKSG